LWQRVGRQIALKRVPGLDLSKTARISVDGVVADERAARDHQSATLGNMVLQIEKNILVLADVIIRASLLVCIVSSVSSAGHVLLILRPADSLSLQQINDRLHRRIDGSSIIGRESVGATSSGCDVVWLTGVCNGLVVGQGNALACDPFETCCIDILALIFCCSRYKQDSRSPAALL
jgi:hypothetical protein